jgi:hypothetical protein
MGNAQSGAIIEFMRKAEGGWHVEKEFNTKVTKCTRRYTKENLKREEQIHRG